MFDDSRLRLPSTLKLSNPNRWHQNRTDRRSKKPLSYLKRRNDRPPPCAGSFDLLGIAIKFLSGEGVARNLIVWRHEDRRRAFGAALVKSERSRVSIRMQTLLRYRLPARARPETVRAQMSYGQVRLDPTSTSPSSSDVPSHLLRKARCRDFQDLLDIHDH